MITWQDKFSHVPDKSLRAQASPTVKSIQVTESSFRDPVIHETWTELENPSCA